MDENIEGSNTGSASTSNRSEPEDEEDEELKALITDTEAAADDDVGEEEYMFDDNDLLVEKVKCFTTLFDLSEDDWTMDVHRKIKAFLVKPDIHLLTIFYTGLKLCADYGFPKEPVFDIMYFIKPEDKQLTLDNFHEEMTFGNLNNSTEGSILNTLGNIYAPIFFNNTTWPDSVKGDFCMHTHTFLSKLTDTHHKMLGLSVMYVPYEGVTMSLEQSLKEKEFLRRLEGIVVQWSRQLRVAVSDSEQTSNTELLTVLDEYHFWVYRWENLSGLSHQLESRPVKHLLDILNLHQSSYLRQFLALAGEIVEATKEARSNVEYLQILKKPAQDLANENNPSTMISHFPGMLNLFRIIWLHSPHYNSRARITLLCRGLSHQIILQCRSFIDMELILGKGHTRSGMSMLEMNIDCCIKYKVIYNVMSDMHNKLKPDCPWDLDKMSIFSYVDSFVQRCHDLIELCQAMITFGRYDETVPVDRPVFGGSQGNNMRKVVENMELMFNKHMDQVKASQHMILDVLAPTWHEEILRFRSRMKDLEQLLENLMTTVLEQAQNVEEALLGLQSLHHYSQRDTLRPAYERHTVHLWTMFLAAVHSVKKELIEGADHRYVYSPFFGGRAMVAHLKGNNLMTLKQMLEDAKWLPKVGLASEARSQYDKMMTTIKETILDLFHKWNDTLEDNTLQRLMRPLMRRSVSRPGLLEANFDRVCLDIASECQYWQLLGYELPHPAAQLFTKWKKVRALYQHVLTVVINYNKIISALSDEERMLFKELIKKLDKKVSPGLFKIDWANEMSADYINDVSAHTAELQDFVDDYKRAVEQVVRLCEKICDTKILYIPLGVLYQVEDLENQIETYRGEALIRIIKHYQDILKNLNCIFDGFQHDLQATGDHWDRFIVNLDVLLEEALRLCVKFSLQTMLTILHGDGTTSPSPLIKLSCDLDRNKIAFTPTLGKISSMGNHFLSGIIGAFKVIPRLYDKLKLKGLGRQPFHVMIEGDADCLRLQDAINNEVNDSVRRIQQHLGVWEPLAQVWQVDKDQFIAEYQQQNPSVESFEKDILNYSMTASTVQAQEVMSYVQFVQINFGPLKMALVRHCSIWQEKLCALLKKLTETALQGVLQYMEHHGQAVMKEPKDLNQMQQALVYLDTLSGEVADKEAEFPRIDEHLEVLVKYEVEMEEELTRRYQSLRSSWKTYLGGLAEAEEMLRRNKESFKAGLLEEVERTKETITHLLEEFLLTMPTTVDVTARDALKFCRTVRTDMDELRAKEDKLRTDLAIFSISHLENQELEKLERVVATLELVWEVVDQWETAWESYRSGNFWKLDTEDMESTAQALYKKLTRMARELKDKGWDVVEGTRLRLDAFKRCLPLFTDLKNECLRRRHWDQVRSLVRSDFDETSPDFTLEAVMSMKMQDFARDINEISNAATMELNIEHGLKSLKDTWAGLSLHITPYKDLRSIYRLKVGDEVFQALEENQVSLSAMKGTKYCEAFMEEVNYWERALTQVLEVLELLLAVQRQWMYLENIFMGDDMRKQLPQETRHFEEVTNEWRDITSAMHETGNVLQSCHQPGLYDSLNSINDKLQQIQMALEKYLETKRHVFPRFYFISNDDLLQILGNSKKPELVQKHLKKLFDNIVKVKMNKGILSGRTEVSGMFSSDGEYLDLSHVVYSEGPCEKWLGDLEAQMRTTLRNELRTTRAALRKMLTKRDKWIREQPGQSCITSSQIQWTTDCTRTLLLCKMLESRAPLKKLRKKHNKILHKFSDAVRGNLSSVQRLKVVSLVTIEIHARDVIDKLYKAGCMDVTAFEWAAQLRFYWDRDIDDCIVRQTNTSFVYGYEYLGNSGRLVITPLTDRCYITLTTALHLHRGGSPKGPAGTGKTETVKDLGKSLGVYVIVVNCSDGLDYKSMGKMFSGLAQTGAWGCFDEFNRINIEVLSVVAQQILSILTGLAQGLKRFNFEGTDVNLVHSCGIFITMNPGYAGRTELPDNLKSMFRPIAMIVPDSSLIAEITLFAEGFRDTRMLAKKVFTLFSLAQQQLSKSQHYDFGLRAMVTLVRYAGRKRRQHPNLPDEEVALLAMRDVNLSKLTSEDLPLFSGITRDLFPGVDPPVLDYSELQGAVEAAVSSMGLQQVPALVTKVLQLYETKTSRHSVMLVGATGTGKTTTWQVLKASLSALGQQNKPNFHAVTEYPINPKALTLGELYGEFNLGTGEWMDGVISATMRKTCADEGLDEKWILFDGPVDAVWVENMNSVMDDNKILTLINSERITMPQQVSLLFEVEDLAVASPATVSRCGMLYLDYKDLGWKPFVKSWLQKQEEEQVTVALQDLFDRFTERVLDFKRLNCVEPVKTSELNCVVSLCRLLDCCATRQNGLDPADPEGLAVMAKLWFLFCFIWSVCGTVDEDGRKKMNGYLREMEGVFPLNDTIYEYYVDVKKKTMINWDTWLSSTWTYPSSAPFYKIIVPTVDTVRYNFLVTSLVRNGYPTLLIGPVGTGKSSTAHGVLDGADTRKYTVLSVNMSAQTTSHNLQDMIGSRVEKRSKETYVPPGGKLMLAFLDDLNLPAKDEYGSQPPLELLRQWIDYGFWYDRHRQTRMYIKDMVVMGAMGHPGGGRNTVSNRTMSRFNIINVPFPDEAQVNRIFLTMLQQHLADFDEEVKVMADGITSMTIELYKSVIHTMLPIPAKMHYLFNLRDICKVLQGLLRSHKDYQGVATSLLRLWTHEALRVFSDRLTEDRDREWFVSALDTQLEKYFELSFSTLCSEQRPPLFGHFINAYGIYEDLTDPSVLRTFLDGQMAEYNKSPGVVRMDLVLFRDAVEHVCRIVRVISQPRGHVLVVGIGGSGRKSLSRLSAFLCEYGIFEVHVTKSYKTADFREDLKKLYKLTGVDNKETSFLFTDIQVVQESFLEIINNILSSGEVPNLYKTDEFEEIKASLADAAKKAKVVPTSENIFNLLIDRVRPNLHVSLCMSPAGSAFRNRLRQYPALINCTTIDWLLEWPREALLEVAVKYLADVDLTRTITGLPQELDSRKDTKEKTLRERLNGSVASMFSLIHDSVVKTTMKMQEEMKRYSYVTPENYLELVTGYKKMLTDKRQQLFQHSHKLSNGLGKIDEARNSVQEMSVELEKAQAKVTTIQQECEDSMVLISNKRREADDQSKVVKQRSDKIGEEEEACKKLAKIAQDDLDEVMPPLEEALASLEALDKKDISEVKSYTNPPPKVMIVMEAVCVLKGVTPDWTESKRLLGETDFLRQLKEFNKNNIAEKILKKVAAYTSMEDFEPEKVGMVSHACKSLCAWVIAIEKYSKVWKIVGPKKQRLEEATDSLRSKQKELSDQQSKLKELQDIVDTLKQDYDEKVKQMEELEDKATELRTKLDRAGILVEGLAGEKDRWTQTVAHCAVAYSLLPGDCLIATAFLAYLGPFVSVYRQELLTLWCRSLAGDETFPAVPHTQDLNLLELLADAAVVREWTRLGLPADDFSMENGVMVAKGTRWPLVIDPQSQCHKWITNLETPNGLIVMDLGQTDFMKILEGAIQDGKPVLLQNLPEDIDPALNPLLSKALVEQSGELVLKLTDSFIKYNKDFRLFMTTKLSNPHYAPEISTKTTLVNFTIKEECLEAQLLALVVKKEKPQLEEMKSNIVTTISSGKTTLQAMEDELLRLLYNSQGSLLENEELLDNLQTSKATAQAVKESLELAEVTQVEIDAARSAYLPCAHRAAILYLILMDMGHIDPMYQFSLDSYMSLFALSIDKTQKSSNLQERITQLNESHTYSVYKSTCRGLFETHKLLFSFHMCIRILDTMAKVKSEEYNFLLKGGVVLDREDQPSNPCPGWLSDAAWDSLTELDKVPGMSGCVSSLQQLSRDWHLWYLSTQPEAQPLVGEWNSVCTEFQRMLLVRSLRPDRLSFCVSNFIVNNLGQRFVEPPVLDIKAAFEGSSPTSPLIFVLSPGVDPTSQLLQLAETMSMTSRLYTLSLGQGQSPVATQYIKAAITEGSWVFLANCHLSLSWMPTLDKIVQQITTNPEVHPGFRLWLSSSPHPKFPVSILQAGIKMTTEPPKGLKANLTRLYSGVSEQKFSMCHASDKYNKLLFSLCFFHAILLERGRFRQLGWNVEYSFNDSDFEVSENILSIYLDEYPETPWDALKYLVAGVNYGGHVTDDWDRRLLMTYINQYFHQDALAVPHYRLSSLPAYCIPLDGSLDSYRDFVAALPNTDRPEAFGQHPNADISSFNFVTRKLCEALMSLQVQSTAATQVHSREEKVLQLTEDVTAEIPELLDVEATGKDMGQHKSPLDVVLLQEMSRYNLLLAEMKHSLQELEKAIKGLVVMSPELEEMFVCMYEGKVPTTWLKAYPTLKLLGSWTRDLRSRVEHLSSWAVARQPPVLFWLSAFTFPTGFLTAVLQMSARQRQVSIDSLTWDFEVVPLNESLAIPMPEVGVYVRGMFLEGAGWDRKNNYLIEPQPMQLVFPMPVIWFKPTEVVHKKPKDVYNCPTYYYPTRGGTSHRPSFVLGVDLKSGLESPDFWVKRGTALLLSLTT